MNRLNAYLARLPTRFAVRSLAELIRFNESHAAGDTGGCSAPAAVAGYPHITVPALSRLASGFEHTAGRRTPPRFWSRI